MKHHITNLMELTNQESGIIVYEGNSVGVYNWSFISDYSIPMSFLGTPVSWPIFDNFAFDKAVKTRQEVADIRKVIPGSIWLTGDTSESGRRIANTNLDIVCDENYDLARLFVGGKDYDPSKDCTAGWVYDLPNGYKIIAPIGWA